MMPKLYYEILKNQNLRDDFEEICDFILVEEANVVEDYWFYTHENINLKKVATDGAGGVYAIMVKENIERSPIVFVGSEGRAGRIAKSFHALINLVTYYPFWKDLLNFSTVNSLVEIENLIPIMEKEITEFRPKYKEVQKSIEQQLNLTKNNNVLEDLVSEVIEKPYFQVFDKEDGGRSDPLMNWEL